MQRKEYEIKYEKLPNNLSYIQLETKDKIVLYVNANKRGEKYEK